MNWDKKIESLRQTITEAPENKETSKDIKDIRDDGLQVKQLAGTINKMLRGKEMKQFQRGVAAKKKEDAPMVISTELDADAFNIMDDKKLVDWKQLDKPTQKTYLEEFLTGKPLIDGLREQLLTMVEKGELIYRKDIIYDKVNGKIISICKMKLIGGVYQFNEIKKVIPQKKKSQSNINKIFKK